MRHLVPTHSAVIPAHARGRQVRVRTHLHVLAACFARAMPETSRPPPIQRAQGMPDARCTRDLVSKCAQKVRPRAYRAAENTRHSLRSGFTAYNVLSPENGSFASVAPWEIERLPEALTPAPRRRDHTPLPYASYATVMRTSRPPHPRPSS